MTISKKYFEYLNHFTASKPVSELIDPNINTDVIALRHDVDHDLDVALEFAYQEHRRGFRATYFVLHDHDYNNDPLFLEKLLQLQDYGHEVGVHLNLFAGWFEDKYDDPLLHLGEWLAKLGDAGVNVEGAATHGARACYHHGVLNSWMFSEQRKVESDYIPLCAEGIPDPTGRNIIPYPRGLTLKRSDGKSLDLWSVSARSMGLKYEAVDLDAKYWSDTGKDWHRTGDPISENLSKGRHQVLMHPIHWLGPPRTIFFLSTASAGSKLVSKAIDLCTSAKVQNEWTLNHRQRNGQHVQEKITTLDSAGLSKKRKYAANLIEYSERKHSSSVLDRIEFNVYLADYIDELKAAFPHAEFYGLCRNGEKVVASILSRGWYSTPDSVRYPRSGEYSSRDLNQFGRAVSYWAETNKEISGVVESFFQIEEVANSVEAFQAFLEKIKFAVHPRLIKFIDLTLLDKIASRNVVDFARLSYQDRQQFNEICSEQQAALGYPCSALRKNVGDITGLPLEKIKRCETNTPSTAVSSRKIDLLGFDIPSSRGVTVVVKNDSQNVIFFEDQIVNGWCVFSFDGSSKWEIMTSKDYFGVSSSPRVVNGSIKFLNTTNALCRVFLLKYDLSDGSLLEKKILTQLTPGWRGLFSEVILCGEGKYQIGLHFSPFTVGEPLSGELELKSASLELKGLDRKYRLGARAYGH